MTAVFAAALDMAYHIVARGGPNYQQALLTGAAAGAGEFLYDASLGNTVPVTTAEQRYSRTAAAAAAPAVVDLIANGRSAGLTQAGLAGAASGFAGHMLAQRVLTGEWLF